MRRGYTIAVAGKGGTGKTTISALLILFLRERGTVLAVDADPSSNLHLALGVPLRRTLGDVREEFDRKVSKGEFPIDFDKHKYWEYKIMEALVESEGFDLLAMGRPEGPGCYCAANHLLRGALDRLAGDYDFIVVDCEAGMEHISRQTTRDVNVLLLIADPTAKGIAAAARMRDLAFELRNNIERVLLVMNRVDGEIPEILRKQIESSGLELAVVIPRDPYLPGLEIEGRPLTELPPDSPLREGAREILRKIGL